MRSSILVIIFAAFLGDSPSTQANTIIIDPSVGGITQILPLCVGGECLHDYISPLYSFHAGDTVELGTVILFGSSLDVPTVSGSNLMTYGPNYKISFGPIPLTLNDLPLPSLNPNPVTLSLEFTFANDSELPTPRGYRSQRRLEATNSNEPIGGRAETGEALVTALEKAGIEFIAENGGGAGVRLAKRSKRK
jgi:hypothetical protein